MTDETKRALERMKRWERCFSMSLDYGPIDHNALATLTALAESEARLRAENERLKEKLGFSNGAWLDEKERREKAEAELAALKAEMEKDEAFYAKMERIKFKEDSAEAALACRSTPQTDPQAEDKEPT